MPPEVNTRIGPGGWSNTSASKKPPRFDSKPMPIAQAVMLTKELVRLRAAKAGKSVSESASSAPVSRMEEAIAAAMTNSMTNTTLATGMPETRAIS